MRRILSVLSFLILTVSASAGPARDGRIFISQPDGTGFYARFAGDQWSKVKMTEEGCAITQESDGWWCYASYDHAGRMSSSGFRVGDYVPQDVLAASMNIPFDVIAQKNAMASRVMRQNVARSRMQPRTLAEGGGDGQARQKYGLVILAEYKGLQEKFTYSRENFVEMLTMDGYSYNGAIGSAKEYFDDQFGGKFDFSFDVSRIVSLPKNRSYYGENDKDTDSDLRPHEMIIDACRLVDDEIDFSKYDQDGDGEVDNVFLFFAGTDEAEGADADHIWSHAWYVRDGAGVNLVLDGVRINRYACASELMLDGKNSFMTSIGTFCHEYCHTFGLPDLYDTDYQVGGYAAATWRKNSLMDAGNYNANGNVPPNLNAVEREFIGLSEPVVISEPGQYSLGPISEGKFYRIDTDNRNEYFLLECRTKTGWDRELGGEGMLVYHIDRSTGDSGYSDVLEKNVLSYQRWNTTNEVNALAEHQCADLIEADGRRDVYSGYRDPAYQLSIQEQSGLFFRHADILSSTSRPGLECWGDARINIGLKNISFDGEKVRFDAVFFEQVTHLVVDVFQDDAILSFESAGTYSGDAKVSYGPTDGPKKELTVAPCAQGKWAVVLDGLLPSTSYKVSVTFLSDDLGEDAVWTSKSFLTKKSPADKLPYIYLGTVARLEDGSFPKGARLPLKLFNAGEAEEVRWTYDGEEIAVSEDYYWTLEKSGTLRAHLVWGDGSEEVIIKEMVVK